MGMSYLILAGAIMLASWLVSSRLKGKFEQYSKLHLQNGMSGAEIAEKMLADRWVCSVARLQRWRTVGEGPQYLKIVGKVLYRLKDIEAYEEACLIRKLF